MTTYTAVPDASIDQDSPATEDLFTLLRDNPIAAFEGSTDAPVNASAWHPFDMTNVGDGGDGEFYDFASDGASASIETPAFANGYEYAIRFEDYSTTANGSFSIDVQLAVNSAWVTLATAATINGPSSYRGLFALYMPRLATFAHAGQWLLPLHTTSGAIALEGVESASIGATASAISKARITSGFSTDNGKLFLLRRREFLTG